MSIAVEHQGLSSLFTAENYRDFLTLENYQVALENLMEQHASLETIQSHLASAPLSQHGKVMANLAYQSHMQRLGVATEGFDLGLEDATFVTVSQEGIGKVLANIWKAIKQAWAKVKEYAKKFFKWFVDKAKAFIGKSDGIVKDLKKHGDTPISGELKDRIVKVAAWAKAYGELIDKTFPDYVKSNREARDLIRQVMKDKITDKGKIEGDLKKIDKVVEKTAEEISKLQDAVPKESEFEGDKEVKVKDLIKEITLIDKMVGDTKSFVDKLKGEFTDEEDFREVYDTWLSSKQAEESQALTPDLMRIGFNGQLTRFQFIAGISVKEFHGVLKELETLISARDADFKSLKGNGEYKPSGNIEKFVKSNSIPHIRTALRLELGRRMSSSKDLYGAMDWVEKHRSDLFDEYEEKSFARGIETDKKKWTVDYYDTQMAYLKTNFSKKRFSHLISVREFLYDKLWS